MSAPTYRPDIDGLRAIAVLPVVLYHLHLPYFPGGYVGVDVFFVISGYLITTILWREISAGTFSIVRFYERRARRILPALFAVIVFSTLVGAFLLTPEEMSNLALSIVGAVLFVQNFVLAAEAGYFDAASETKPLLHIWSLAVEEQFYIFFPPLLWLFARWLGRKGLLVLIALALGVSLLGAVWLMHRPVLNFYMLPLRAWELLAGSLLAIMAGSGQPQASRLRDAVSLGGLAAILLPAMLYSSDTPFPGYTAVPPVVGAAALIWAGESSIAARLLSWKPVVRIGLISYSLYLWHWPVIAFHSLIFPEGVPLWHAAGLLVLSLLLATLSWLYVETPFRRQGRLWPSRRRVFAQSGKAMAVCLGVALAILMSNGWPWRASPATIALAEVAREKHISDNQCKPDVPLFTLRGRERGLCSLGSEDGNGPPVMIWGDSHVGAWYPMLDKVFRDAGVPAVAISMAGCPIAFGLERVAQDKGGCLEAAEAIQRYIESEQVDRLLIVGSWFGVLTEKNTIYKGQRSHDYASRAGNVSRAIAETGDALREMGVVSGFLMTAPGARYSVPEALFRKAQIGFYPEIRRSQQEYDGILAPVRTAALGHFNHVMELSDLLCGTGRCEIMRNGQALYYDSNHPSLHLNKLVLPDMKDRLAGFLTETIEVAQ